MSPVSKTVDEAAGLIRQRLKELDAERSQLERALSTLTDGREGRRGPGRPGGSDQAVKLVATNPGVSASEMAKKMNIKPNYLYRVMADLEKQGKVRKDGRAYHPAKG